MFLKEHFFKEGRLTEAQALRILEEATRLLKMEPNMVTVTSPVTSALIVVAYAIQTDRCSYSLWGYTWPICMLNATDARNVANGCIV